LKKQFIINEKRKKSFMSKLVPVNSRGWIPAYEHHQEHIYILLTSLNLGGAEKIVSDQLWANYYSKAKQHITLIVIYDKDKEHSIPPDVNVVRLGGELSNGKMLFQQIAYEQKPLVCHLINDKIAQYLFDLNLHLHIVIHNDKRGWSNTTDYFNHPQIISLVAVCHHVRRQLEEVTDKPIVTFRHQINQRQFQFKPELRAKHREVLGIQEEDIVIGMIGRICEQKNYFMALDVIAQLSRENPRYKLLILGGFEKMFFPLYLQLLHKVNHLKLHNNVIMPGFKNNPQHWVNAFDIGLNTSYFEGLSMATQELMMNGLPVVLSKVCGQPEIFDPRHQLHFFDVPEELNTPETREFHLDYDSADQNQDEEKVAKYELYLKQVHTISNLIRENHNSRMIFSDADKQHISRMCYGSHEMWNLLNHIYPKHEEQGENKDKEVRAAFLTSNLNLGGAQRSLVNILKQFKDNDINMPLILINQSNQQQFYQEILSNQIEHYLCHSSIDVFDIGVNLFKYLHRHKINRLVFWNVESKMKLLISKLLKGQVDMVDVSPGDYVFNEMENEIDFQEAIYHYKEEYFSNIHRFVSKYDNRHLEQSYKQYLKHDTQIVPNGVYVSENNFYTAKNFSPFKILVCGRISPSKHLDVIFDAWQKFVSQYPEQKFVLDAVGSAEQVYQDYYHQLDSDYATLIEQGQIVWQGHHDNPQSIMKNYHAIIVLGTHQGSPNVVLEAGACKLPVIANDSGGTREIINEDTGYLLPVMPESAPLLDTLNHIFNHYDEAMMKAENCYNLIEKEFSLQTMFNRYKEIICE
jgi:glycosyltransferase involved in cell wall biosynthesis